MPSPSLSDRVVHLTATLGLVATLEVELMGLCVRLVAVDEERPFRCLGTSVIFGPGMRTQRYTGALGPLEVICWRKPCIASVILRCLPAVLPRREPDVWAALGVETTDGRVPVSVRVPGTQYRSD